MKRVILASGSPRRADLLRSLGIDFDVCVTDADETVDTDDAEAVVKTLSRRKAECAAAKYPSDIVVAADTVVELGGSILGKPKNEADAKRMLRMLSGTRHTVYTGVTVASDGEYHTDVSATDVYMNEITDDEIDSYIRTGEPFDKAGAYGIQTLGGMFVERVDGDYFNVTGMPKALTARLLSRAGLTVCGILAWSAK